MSEPKTNTFKVDHPDLGTVQVVAADKYAAITTAAKEWGVRWTQIAKDCTVADLGSTVKTLCKRCGRVWVPSPGYCPQCAALIAARKREIDRMAQAREAQRRKWR